MGKLTDEKKQRILNDLERTIMFLKGIHLIVDKSEPRAFTVENLILGLEWDLERLNNERW